MQISKDTRSHYERIGGEEKIRVLVQRFYQLMDELPETLFLCIVPQDYGDMNLEMTPVMREKFPVMEQFLLEELSKLNVTLERADHA